MVTLTVPLTGFLSSPVFPASSEADELQLDKNLAFVWSLPCLPSLPSSCPFWLCSYLFLTLLRSKERETQIFCIANIREASLPSSVLMN